MFTELRGSSRDGVHRLIYDILISNYVLKTKDELLELTGSTSRLGNWLMCCHVTTRLLSCDSGGKTKARVFYRTKTISNTPYLLVLHLNLYAQIFGQIIDRHASWYSL